MFRFPLSSSPLSRQSRLSGAAKYSSRVLTQLNDATYNQSLAADQWAFYQAKSIKLNSYEIAQNQLVHSASAADAGTAKLVEDYKQKVTTYRKAQED